MGYTKSQVEKLKKDKELADKMWANPELFYQVQNSFECLLNLAALVDIAAQDVGTNAPFMFKGRANSLSKLQKNLKAIMKELNDNLDEVMEYLRTDPIIFGGKAQDMFVDTISDTYKLYDIFKMMVLKMSTVDGFIQLDSVAKTYINNPTLLKQDKKRIGEETLNRHKKDFSPEVIQRWEKFIEENK